MALQFLYDGYFAGKVGIGTESPGSKLTINETSTATAAVSIVTARYGISLQGAGTSNTQYLLNLQSNGGSTDVMRVQSSGNVGIGTASPNGILHIKGLNEASTYITNQKSSTKFSEWHVGGINHYLLWDSTSDLRFGTETGLGGAGASEKMRINSAGNVGIGTTNPGAKLDVKKGSEGLYFAAGGDTGNARSLQFTSSANLGSNGAMHTINAVSGNGAIALATASAERMRILSNGNVGIGTTSPTAKLQVSGKSFFTNDIFTLQNKGIFFNGLDDFSSGIAGIDSGTSVRIFAGGSEKVRVKSTGNVGIGTTSPSQKLQVEGNSWIKGVYYDTSGDAGASGQVLSSTTTGTTWIDGSAIPGVPAGSGTLNTVAMWTPDGDTLGNSLITTSGNDIRIPQYVVHSFDTNTFFGFPTTDTITFSTDASERMRITSTGNVGIGRSSSITARLFVEGPVDTSTISTSSTPAAKINNGGAISNWIGSNGYNYGYIQSIQDDGSNNLKPLSLQPLGGNVGIGVTNPDHKLRVNGDARIGNLHIKTADFGSGGTGKTIYADGAGSGVLGFTSTTAFDFSNGTTSRMRIDSAGDVGIGTTNPTRKFVVSNGGASGIEIEPNYVAGVNEILSFDRTVGATAYETMRFNGGDFEFQIGGAEKMRITSGGNVGIGTTSPAKKLHVLNSTNEAQIRLGQSGSGSYDIGVYSGDKFSIGRDADTQEFTLSNGNVGVGTTSPTAKLHVAGTGLFTGLVSGITPVAAANFVTKAYVDGSGGGTGPFLPLAGGTMTGTNGVLFPDNFILNIGNSSDLKISHDGTDSFIEDSGTGSLYVTTNAFRLLNPAENEQIITAFENGAVNLFYDSSQKFETTTFGSKVTGYLQVTSGVDVIGGNIDLVDNSKIRLGTSQDLQIYHDGSNSYIKDVGTGSIIINGDFFRILNSAGNSQMFRCDANDSVQLYYDNSVKLATTNTGVTVTGAATATTFLGDLNGTINTATTGVTQVNSVDNTTIATTAYVNNKIGLIPAGLVFQGTWNAATNTPTLTSGSGTTGNFYIVSVAGSTNLDGITDWKVGDWAVFIEQGASDQWEKIDNSSVLDGIGTGGSVAGWAGSGTSNTLTNSPITFSGNNITIPGNTTITNGQLTVTHDTNNAAKIIQTATSMSNSTYTFEVDSSSHNSNMSSAGAMAVDVNSGRAFTITGAGNVGIGTSGPGIIKLNVVKDNSSGNALQIDNSGASRSLEINHNIDNSGTVDDIVRISSNGSRKMTIANNGNVGIGTTSPVTKLDISVTPSAPWMKLINANETAFNLTTYNNGTNNGSSVYAFKHGLYYGTTENAAVTFYRGGSSVGGFLTFTTNNGTEKMRIDSAGNVGIGTTSPDSFNSEARNLVVNGSGNVGISIATTTTTGNSSVVFADGTGGTAGYRGRLKYGHATDYMAFFTAAAERLRIDSAGNVGIGTTTPQSKLQVAGGIQMADDTATAVVGKVGTMRYRTGTEYVEVTGTELVTNGDFATDSSWAKQPGWTISGGFGVGNLTTNTYGGLSQSPTLSVGAVYRYQFTISSYTSGAVRFAIGATDNGTSISGNGFYSGYITYTAPHSGGATLAIFAWGNFVGSVDNVSVVEVTAEDASYADMCMQTGASTYEWVNIVRNTY
mgnify:CR=1 FL=1